MNALLTLLLFLFFAPALHAQEPARELLSDAQRAYLRGDLDAAKAGFQQILEIDPRNEVARRYLRMIQAQEKRTGGGGQLEKQLRELVIPRVEFKQATLNSALEYLKQEAARQADLKTSFVVKPEVDQMKKITLSLYSVPFTEALRYIGDLAEVSFTIQPHAIVVSNRGVASPEPPETPQVQ